MGWHIESLYVQYIYLLYIYNTYTTHIYMYIVYKKTCTIFACYQVTHRLSVFTIHMYVLYNTYTTHNNTYMYIVYIIFCIYMFMYKKTCTIFACYRVTHRLESVKPAITSAVWHSLYILAKYVYIYKYEYILAKYVYVYITCMNINILHSVKPSIRSVL